MKDSILVFSAHSDDFVIGAGGTIAKYAKEGRKVTAVVFSYGEKSHPWLKEEVVKKMRSEETFVASRELGCKTIFFDLHEFNFLPDFRKDKLEPSILKLIEKEKPSKIFTHSNEDPHPDHIAAHEITLKLYQKLSFHPELYVYSVWNPVSLKTNYLSLYVDISKTFSAKMKSLKAYRSQQIHIAYPTFLLVFKAIANGLKIRRMFAEMFYRLK